MNYGDFNTQPDGFPLESDATLGFMQATYLSGLRALARLSGSNDIILSGLVRTGSSVTEGWIYKDGDLVFFEAGSYDDTYIIETTAEQKANQNGQLVDRYFTKVARFGTSTGTQYNFADLVPIDDLRTTQDSISRVATAGNGSTVWNVISGLEPVSGGVGGISSGALLYRGRLHLVPSYPSAVSSGSPVYLTPAMEWSTVFSNEALEFSPFCEARISAKIRKAVHPFGSALLFVNSDFPSDQFPGGIGVGDWDGWRIADGTNGTTDLTGISPSLTPVQNRQL
jgi:hypothetical protein